MLSIIQLLTAGCMGVCPLPPTTQQRVVVVNGRPVHIVTLPPTSPQQRVVVVNGPPMVITPQVPVNTPAVPSPVAPRAAPAPWYGIGGQ